MSSTSSVAFLTAEFRRKYVRELGSRFRLDYDLHNDLLDVAFFDQINKPVMIAYIAEHIVADYGTHYTHKVENFP